MEYKLVCLDAVAPRPEISLDKLPVVIGRSDRATIRFFDTWTSRFHCKIDQEDGRLVVEDLRSSNGTLVNGAGITKTTLNPGDTLTVGISTFELTLQACRFEAAESLGYETAGALDSQSCD